MMLVHGAPGFGKSHRSWGTLGCAESNGAAFPAGQRGLDAEILSCGAGQGQSRERRPIPERLNSSVPAPVGPPCPSAQIPIVIDEAEFTLNQGAAALEKVRDLSDRARKPRWCSSAWSAFNKRIARHKQIASRIAQVVEFTPATLADVEHGLPATVLKSTMSPALMAEVHRLSGGRMRETLNVIAAVERIAAINGLESAVDVADMEGAALSFDWQTRTPKGVRQASAERR